MDALHLVHSQPPALVVGENNEVFRDTNQRVVLFHIGRNMAYARPELFLARIYPGEELRDLIYGLCVLYNRQLQHDGHPSTVDNWAGVLSRSPQQALKRLQPMVMQGYHEVAKGKPLLEYMAAVEHTAIRAGLLASGDLVASGRGVTDGGEGASHMPVPERLKELVYFAVSKPYLQLRKTIGASLSAPAQQ